MVQKNLECFHCKTLNCGDVSMENPNAIFYCVNCGFAFNPDPEKLKKLNDPNPGNWLPCIPLKGVVAREPLGETPDGYMDPVNGGAKPHSREEYKKMFFIDPEVYLDWNRKRGGPLKVPGFECKEPAPQPISVGDDPAKLKQDQLAGRIDRMDYLEKLMKLLKSGKVTQAYYDNEKKRILAEM
jgi:hypothetical protein